MIAASVNAALGRAGLLLMLAACVVGALTLIVGVRRGDRRMLQQGARYSWMAFGGIVLAVVMMQRALITRDFSMAYIQQVGSADTPTLYNIAAMWSALEGSILLWALILGGFTAAVAWRFRKRTNDVLVGWALIVMYVIAGFFAALSFGPADPFGPGAVGVTEGPDRTRCCRTTSWCCSIRRSCTSATSASPCRSRSRSPRSSPAASARDG